MRNLIVLLTAALAAVPAVALAQSALPAPATPPIPQTERPPSGPPATVFDDTYVTLGIGVGTIPRYEGSDDYRLFPAPLLQGRVGGFDFARAAPDLLSICCAKHHRIAPT
ncbi:MAG: MipA/OmpV family protein [Rhodobacteraceae bacterium]|nr:MipA/OmpV family protein [Paracoccaceae bacterium]